MKSQQGKDFTGIALNQHSSYSGFNLIYKNKLYKSCQIIGRDIFLIDEDGKRHFAKYEKINLFKIDKYQLSYLRSYTNNNKRRR